MLLVCFCCVSETVLTINRRWCLLFVGSDNKKMCNFSVPLAIAVGNKRLQSSWCADSQGSRCRRTIVRARFSNFCGLAPLRLAMKRLAAATVSKTLWKKVLERQLSNSCKCCGCNQFQVNVCWRFKCLLERFRTICFAVLGWRICWPTGDGCGQAWTVTPGDILVNTIAVSAWRRGSATALGSTRGSSLNVCDLRAAAQLKILCGLVSSGHHPSSCAIWLKFNQEW